MRILFVNQYYPPDVSATAYLLGELSEDLARDHEVWVVAGSPSYNPEVGTFRPAGVRLRRVWTFRFGRAGMAGRLLNYATFVIGASVRALMVPRPDVVVAMTDPPIIGLVGLLAALRFRRPFVHVYQDIFPDVAVALGRLENPAVIALWDRLNRLLRRRAAGVAAIGRDMREKLEQEGAPRDRVAFLPNWADDVAPPGEAMEAARHAMGADGRYLVMHAGNIGLAQDLGTLIEAADRLRGRNDIVFVLMGDGAAKKALEARVEQRSLSNVRFFPYRPKDEAQAFMGAADLHVISLAFGLWGCVVPSKVYGIMAMGRPFVAAVEPGSEIDRIIQETGAGVRVNPGDATMLAEVIGEFADRRRDGRRAGHLGRREFESRYRRSLAVARYQEFLARSVGKVPA